jgi:hypothetical protein
VKQNREKTVVVFRKFKNGGDVLALFPEIPEVNGCCLSYQHIGQHGSADYSHCISITTPANPQEHRALRQELENMGYRLEVRQKYIRTRKGA